MTVNALSLPEDVPWRRIAISPDMHATRTSDPLPPRWRTSLAVYAFDPDPDPAAPDSDELTTFLKVTATITGFQPAGRELGRHLAIGDFQWTLIERYREITAAYYPALSAVLQVAVVPAEGEWDLAQYPYLSDFEPKKRELVELVTETGEALTQSAETVNVRKGTTTVDSTEMNNIDRGGSFGVSAQYAGAGIGVQGSAQREVGTRARVGTEALNMVTIDASREKRESYSHTTNLSQLYQLLTSYHSGTNRALFLINARPHLLQSELTFVNGPRHLEGIQEFFLVVRRPKVMERFCVKAVLETAHVRERMSEAPVARVAGTPSLPPLRQPLSLPTADGSLNNRWTIPLPAGSQVDRSRGGGRLRVPLRDFFGQNSTVESELPAGVAVDDLSFATSPGTEQRALPTFAIYDDHVDVSAGVGAPFPDPPRWQCTVSVFATPATAPPPSPPPPAVRRQFDLFLTAREVASCPDLIAEAVHLTGQSAYVSYEMRLEPEIDKQFAQARSAGPDAAAAANAVSRAVAEKVIASFQTGTRYVPGEVDFVTSASVLDDLRATLAPEFDTVLDSPVAKLSQVPATIRDRFVGATTGMTLRSTIFASPPALAARLDVSLAEARKIQVELIGLKAAPPSDGEQGSVIATVDGEEPATPTGA